jgi:hypothetical protein
MAKRKSGKSSTRAAGKSRSKSGKAWPKPAAKPKARTAARKTSAAKPPGSGLVYTSLLREALASRTR